MSGWQILRRIWFWFSKLFWMVLLTVLMVGATVQQRDPISQIRRYTRSIEFNYFDWTLDALFVKLEQYSLGTAGYLGEADRHD